MKVFLLALLAPISLGCGKLLRLTTCFCFCGVTRPPDCPHPKTTLVPGQGRTVERTPQATVGARRRTGGSQNNKTKVEVTQMLLGLLLQGSGF